MKKSMPYREIKKVGMESELLECRLRLLLLCFFLSISFHSYSQNVVSGVILNKNGETLSYATITANSEDDSRLVAYAISDVNGKYSLELKDSVYLFKVSYLGYQPFSSKRKVDGNEVIDFRLTADATNLEEIVVKSKSLDASIRNDTIKYNIDRLTNGTEENLKDVLNKLPGVEIDENGKIKANGKKIDKLLIDGKEFFGDQHQLATENIGSEMVAGISLLENFHDFSDLQSQTKTGKSAMNIEIDEDYKGSVKGNIEIGGGYENRYEFSTNLFSFREKTNLFFIGSSNNIGNQIFSFEDYISFQGGIEKLVSDNMNSATISGKDLPSYLFTDDNVRSKNEQFSALNFSYNPSSKFKFNSYVIFDRINSTEAQIAKQTYFTSAENIVLNLDNSSENTFLINNSFINATYKPTKEAVLEYSLNFSPQENDLSGADSFETQRFSTVRNNRSYSLNQVLNYKRIFDKYLFSSSIFHSIKENDDDLLLSSDNSFLGLSFQDNDYSASQNIENPNSSYGLNAKLSRALNKSTSFRITYQFTNRNDAFRSEVNENTLTNDSELDVTENQIGAYLFNKGNAFLNYKIGSFYTFLNSNGISTNSFLPFINLKFNFKKTHALNLSYKKTIKLPFAENVIGDSYISNFNTLINNQNIVSNTLSKYDNFGVRYFIYDLFSGTLVTMGGDLIFGRDVIATNTINAPNSIINYYSLADTDENVNFYLLFDKKFSKIPFKLRLKNTLTLIEKNNFINDEEYTTNSKILSNGIFISSNFKSPHFNFELGYKRRQNTIKSEGIDINSKVILNEPFINLFFNFHQFDFKLNSSIEFFASEVSNQNFYRLDPILNYKTADKRWTFYIKGIDILNMNKNSIIENKIYENYLEEKRISILRGLIIGGFKYKF